MKTAVHATTQLQLNITQALKFYFELALYISCQDIHTTFKKSTYIFKKMLFSGRHVSATFTTCKVAEHI